MAANLIRAGYEVAVWNRTPGRARDLLELGAEWADSPLEAARSASVVITMVSDDAAIEQVYYGDDGVMEGLQPGTIVIDSSTISPGLARRLAEDAEKRLDARVAEGRLSASRAAQLKASIKAHIEAAVDSRDLLKPIHRHPGHRFLMHKIAAVLGMPGSELESRLAEGRSIAEIAKSRGLSEDQLIEKLKDSLSEELRHFVRMKHSVRKSQDAKDEAKR